MLEGLQSPPYQADAPVIKPLQSAKTPQDRGMHRAGLAVRPLAPRHGSISLTFLAVSLAALAGALVAVRWLWQPGRGLPGLLLPVVILALIGVLDRVWAFHARTTRYRAVLDAYADREIARSRCRQDGYHTRWGEPWAPDSF
jgi:hypothetical protein